MGWTLKIKDPTVGLSNAWMPYEIYIITDDFENINLSDAIESMQGGGPVSADITVGAEAADTINVAIQLNDMYGDDLAVRGCVRAYLSDNVNGDTLLANPPTGGVAIGTDGVLVPSARGLQNDVITHGNLIISGADVVQYKTTQTSVYTINGVTHSYAATDNLTFTLGHKITASKFGIILIQINAAGTVSTKVPAATQAYDTAAAALAALPAPDYGNVMLGYCAIENNAGEWTANVDDLTNGSDLTTAAFTDAGEVAPGYGFKSFDLVSESDGDIDVNIYETGARTMYLVVVMPSGALEVSPAITFA